MQLKLVWKLLKDDNSLWVKLVRKKYLKNDSLFTHKVSVLASWQWKHLMRLRNMFCQGLRWQIGNGSDIRFWDDNWLLPSPLSSLLIPPDSSHSLLVSDFILPCRTWDRSKLARYLPQYLVEKALSFFIPFHSQQDSLVWGLTADGEFSVKSGALLVQGLVNGDVTIVDYAWIWKLLPPPKIKNFL